MESVARLMKELPKDYEAKCYEKGAITRRRGVDSPSDLMMLSLFHLNNGCSLVEISEVARITKLGEMSDVAFMNRFAQCGEWFRGINEQLSAQCLINYQKPEWMADKTVLALDASDVKEKGRSGRIYRFHYALDIFKMVSAQHKITTSKEGESLCNFTLEPGQLVIADRCYSNIKGMGHCLEAGAEFILRIRKNSFTVTDVNNRKIDYTVLFTNMNYGESIDVPAFATNANGGCIPIRLCVRRKTPEAIEATKKKLRRSETKNQHKITDETKWFNEYIVVATNLEKSVSADEVLDAYRLRWQVEIHFKRLKSILDFGELPKRKESSVIAWLNGKIMISLLIEIIIAKTSFSPQEQNEP